MSRNVRVYNPTTNLYHIIIRGIDKNDIFYDDIDRKKFLDELKNTIEKYKYELCCYCLMDNHVHLVIFDKEQNISKSMQSLLIRYTSYFNKKYERVGHLLQGKFISKNIMDKHYFLNVCRYIHQNPVNAQICTIDRYKWSSYNEFLNHKLIINEKELELINPKLLLNRFSKSDNNLAISEFIKFHKNKEEFLDGHDFIEYEMYSRLSDEDLRNNIIKLLDIQNISEIKQYNGKVRDKMIDKLKIIKGTSCSQIGRVTGINRKIIERVFKNI